MSEAKVISVELERYLVRRIEIEGRYVSVYDGVIEDVYVQAVYQLLRGLPYRWENFDRPDVTHSRKWKYDFQREEYSNPFFQRIIQMIYGLPLPMPMAIARIYVNFGLPGECHYTHTDGLDGLTVLYFANLEWNIDWHGELFFCDSKNEPLHVVLPKPGRIVVFDPAIIHRASNPSRECFEPRMNIAFKFMAKKDMGIKRDGEKTAAPEPSRRYHVLKKG